MISHSIVELNVSYNNCRKKKNKNVMQYFFFVQSKNDKVKTS